MASFSDTKITPANGQKIPTVDGSSTGYMLTQELEGYILSSKGQNNGLASLDSNGKLVSTQLPDFANDVLAYDSIASFPAEGADGVLYIAKDTNTLYRWNGTQYISVSADTSELEQKVEELDAQVEDLETEVSQQNLRITNLEYENRIVKAVIKKKIAEETEATGTVIPFPSTGEDGYPLAEWGEVKRLKSESLVWNQLVDTMYAYARVDRIGKNSDGTFDITTSAQPSTTIASQVAFDTKITKDHVYLPAFAIKTNADLLSGVSIAIMDKSNYSVLQRGSNYNPIKATAEGNYMVIFQLFRSDYTSSVTIRVSSAFVDLTYLFGVTEAHQVTGSMIAWVRQYAEVHPEYTAGTLLDSVYESGVSEGRNLWIGETGSSVTEENGYFKTGTIFDVGMCLRFNGGRTVFKKGTQYRCAFVGRCSTLSSAPIIWFYDDGTWDLGGNYVQYALTDSEVWSYSTNGKNVIGVRCGASNGTGYIKKDTIVLSEGIDRVDYTPHMESTLDLSFLNSVPNIGIEGTVIDFEKNTVTWTHGKRSLSSLTWVGSQREDGKYRYQASVEGIKTVASSTTVGNIKCSSYTKVDVNETFRGTTDKAIAIGTSASVFVYDSQWSASDMSLFVSQNIHGDIVYELATPITKTFAELGITIPPSWDGGKPWIRVEAGGTFTVVSSGAEAEATVSFVTDLTRS